MSAPNYLPVYQTSSSKQVRIENSILYLRQMEPPNIDRTRAYRAKKAEYSTLSQDPVNSNAQHYSCHPRKGMDIFTRTNMATGHLRRYIMRRVEPIAEKEKKKKEETPNPKTMLNAAKRQPQESISANKPIYPGPCNGIPSSRDQNHAISLPGARVRSTPACTPAPGGMLGDRADGRVGAMAVDVFAVDVVGARRKGGAVLAAGIALLKPV